MSTNISSTTITQITKHDFLSQISCILFKGGKSWLDIEMLWF